MNKKTFILGVLICIVSIGIFLIGNYDNQSYRKNKNVESNLNATMAYVLIDEEGNETTSDTFPSSSEYYLNFAKSFCENGSAIGWDTTNNKVLVTASKKDNCKIYFTKGTGAVNPKEDILASNTLVTATQSFSAAMTNSNSNIYKATDDYGTSYYFRGAATNNYVKFGPSSGGYYYPIGYEDAEIYRYDTYDECFSQVALGAPWSECAYASADMYWRIVRINGDGTIRLIYDGTSAVSNGTTHTATIDSVSYSQTSSSKSAGYTYNKSDTDTTQIDSAFKTAVDNWYENNLKNEYGHFLADNGFCNDREIAEYIYYDSEMNETTEANASVTDYLYGSYTRLQTNKSPVLICTNKDDKYTVNKLTGNGLLKYPIGLLTVDEAFFAGGTTANNTSYYLYSGESFWTMSPHAYGYIVQGLTIWANYNGKLQGTNSQAPFGIRPVINLRADLLFTGSGTQSDPYKVAGFE